MHKEQSNDKYTQPKRQQAKREKEVQERKDTYNVPSKLSYLN